MSLDERSTLILTQLIHAETYVPIEEITEKLHISKRTVYYDLDKINGWLQDHDLVPVKHLRSLGLYLPDETKKEVSSMIQKINTWQYYYSEKERKALLAILLITSTQTLFLNDLMDKIGVSRGTTNKELNQLKKEMLSFNLRITFHRKTGYLIEGNEYDKRKALVHYLSQVLSKDGWNQLISEIQWLLNNELEKNRSLKNKPSFTFKEDLKAIYKIIDECENELGIQITDEMLHNLAFRLIVFSKRLLQGERVVMDQDEKEILKLTPEYLAAKKISKKLEELFLIEFPEDEICYITMNLLSSKVNYISNETRRDEELKHLKLIIQRMIDDFQKYACVFFKDRALMEEQMFIHLKTAYYRIKYGLEVENPITETIKQKYREVFEITKKVVHYLEDAIGKRVSEKEIAYIAMYFGGWMQREGARPITRKKAIIVCGNGLSTSRMLQAQLENLFSTLDIVSTVSLREYETQHFNVDFIFSTAPIKKREIPVFIVSPILTDTEKEMLLNQINNFMNGTRRGNSPSVKTLMDIIKKHANVTNEKDLYEELTQFFLSKRQFLKESRKPMLNELITEEMIQLHSHAKDWKEAIRIAADPLLEKGYITQDYVTAMIENIQQLGPYIVLAPKIAIPHARPEQGVNQLGMSLLCLEKCVPFSEDKQHDVNLIIVLAAIDNETHLKALSQLSKMLSDDDNIKMILEADSKEQILQLINKYSTN
jgi:mannitol operon transcriptional antiterminator